MLQKLITSFYFITSVFSQQTNIFVMDTHWDTNIHILNFCIEDNGYQVHIPLIETAMSSINSYMFNTDLESTPLFLRLNTGICNIGDMKIILKNNYDREAAGSCTRKYKPGNIKHPELTYEGCDIIINICKLQTAASFYNVLLHELLHSIGLGHFTPIRPNTVMSYAVTASFNGNIIYDDSYITIHPDDVLNIHYIVKRDFPSYNIPDQREIQGYVPKYSPYKHVSGTDKYIINNNIISTYKCWILNPYYTTLQPSSSPTSQPTSQPTSNNPTSQPTSNNPTSQPTFKPTNNPTSQPTFSPTSNPTSQISKKQRPKRRPNKRSFVDRFKQHQKNGKNKLNIKTKVNPNIYGSTNSGQNFDIRSRVSPEIEIDSYGNNLNFNTEINPIIQIRGGGSNNHFQIYTEVSPIIKLRSQRQVSSSASSWNLGDCFFGDNC